MNRLEINPTDLFELKKDKFYEFKITDSYGTVIYMITKEECFSVKENHIKIENALMDDYTTFDQCADLEMSLYGIADSKSYELEVYDMDFNTMYKETFV